jgi:hypothetical protein
VRSCPSGGYWLVAGHHRFEAAKKLKWQTIDCIILEDGIEADRTELIEIDENLMRAELTPAEHAHHIARRKEIYERLHPETKHGGAPGKAGGGKQAKDPELRSFVVNTSRKTGKSRSTIAKAATRGKKVKVLADIVGTSLDKGTEIDALAKLREDEQRKLAARAKAGEKVSAKQKPAPTDPASPHRLIGKEIREAFGDGQWHSVAATAAELRVPSKEVEEALSALNGAYPLAQGFAEYVVKCEREEAAAGARFRIFPWGSSPVGIVEIKAKLLPLVEGLEMEGKQNAATISAGAIGSLAGKIRHQIEEWAK